jgi:hypothetical protein
MIVQAGEPPKPAKVPLVYPFNYACPILLKPLLAQIGPDLPGYINRSLQRQRHPGDSWRYLIRLSPPNYWPLSLQTFSDRHPEFQLQDWVNTPNLYQVFFTSLERVYTPTTTEQVQQFHWLIFQQNNRYQWHLVKIFSQDPQGHLRESQTEPIGQGISQRLQECWRIP